MHIEKNVFNSIIGTLLEIPGKNKDGIAARLDLLNMGVRTDLQPEYGQRRTRLPPGLWNLSRIEKRAVCNSFYGMKVPEDSRLLGLKSHDCYTLMQQLLHVAIHSVLEQPASTFIQWLHFKVQSELNGKMHNGISKNLRWLVVGPSMAVPSYRSYLINGVKFNTKAQDDVQTIQNSGVYLLAHTMQVASANDKNSIVSNMGFYGVIQEIWDLDYQKFRIPVLKCDWIDNTLGLVVNELGFTLVDMSKIEHINDQFVMASQVKQVFYVHDPMHHGWSVVLSMPNSEYNDVIGDDVLGDTKSECEPFTRGIPNVDTFDDLEGEFGNENIRDGCEHV
ncbi:unnamed protein product [Prunus armeniaca]